MIVSNLSWITEGVLAPCVDNVGQRRGRVRARRQHPRG